MTIEAVALNFKTNLSINADKVLKVSEKDIECVLKEYNITPDILQDLITNIRNWYEKQPHLPKGMLHDRLILGHLIQRHFSAERVKETIDNSFSAKRRIPELLTDRNPRQGECAKYLKTGYWIVLPDKTPDNHRVSFFRLSPDDIDASVPEIMKIAIMYMEYRIWNDVSFGDRWVLDFQYTTLNYAIQWTPAFISKILFYLTSCFGTRLRSVDLVNMPAFGATVLSIFKRSIKSKLVERIHISTQDDVKNKFPKEILPVEYGGEKLTCMGIADEWTKTFQTDAWTNYFIEQENLTVDESKRETPNKIEDLFGVNGTFRQLSVD